MCLGRADKEELRSHAIPGCGARKRPAGGVRKSSHLASSGCKPAVPSNYALVIGRCPRLYGVDKTAKICLRLTEFVHHALLHFDRLNRGSFLSIAIRTAFSIFVLVGITTAFLFSSSSKAQAPSTDLDWLAPGKGTLSYGYFDPKYPTLRDPAQHIGSDIDVAAGADIVSPVDGTIVANQTSLSAPEAHLIIKEGSTGYLHVLGHVDSKLSQGDKVFRGQSIAKAKKWITDSGHDNSHVHWGINSKTIGSSAVNGWGWGRAPGSATVKQATGRGWINTDSFASSRSASFSRSPQGPTRPSPNSATYSVGSAVFNLPDRARIIPEIVCDPVKVKRVQELYRGALRCAGEFGFGKNAVLVYYNWAKDSKNPGLMRALAVNSTVVDLGSISARTGIEAVIVEDRFYEILAITLDGWSKKPEDAPYLRYRFESTPNPKLSLIGNTLSSSSRNPIVRDLAAVNNPLKNLIRIRPVRSAATAPRSTSAHDSSTRNMGSSSEGSSRGPCTTADWAGTVRSIPDLFECDSTRAIESLSTGRDANIKVGSVRFAQGNYIVSFTDRPGHTNSAIREMDNSFSWDKWIDATQSKFYEIVCVFPPSRGRLLKQGATLVSRVNLDSYSGTTILLKCT